VWSGTSFAAPVLAGELASAIAKAYAEDGDVAQDRDAAVSRLRRVVKQLPGRSALKAKPAEKFRPGR
jgi:hypothetical protein